MAKIPKTVCPTNNDDVDADITSHDTYEKGFPHNAFKRLRDDEPAIATPKGKMMCSCF